MRKSFKVLLVLSIFLIFILTGPIYAREFLDGGIDSFVEAYTKEFEREALDLKEYDLEIDLNRKFSLDEVEYIAIEDINKPDLEFLNKGVDYYLDKGIIIIDSSETFVKKGYNKFAPDTYNLYVKLANGKNYKKKLDVINKNEDLENFIRFLGRIGNRSKDFIVFEEDYREYKVLYAALDDIAKKQLEEDDFIKDDYSKLKKSLAKLEKEMDKYNHVLEKLEIEDLNQAEQALKIYQYVYSHGSYNRQIDGIEVDWIGEDFGTYNSRENAEIFQKLANLAGLETSINIATYKINGSEYGNYFNEVKLDGDYYIVDTYKYTQYCPNDKYHLNYDSFLIDFNLYNTILKNKLNLTDDIDVKEEIKSYKKRNFIDELNVGFYGEDGDEYIKVNSPKDLRELIKSKLEETELNGNLEIGGTIDFKFWIGEKYIKDQYGIGRRDEEYYTSNYGSEVYRELIKISSSLISEIVSEKEYTYNIGKSRVHQHGDYYIEMKLEKSKPYIPEWPDFSEWPDLPEVDLEDEDIIIEL